MNRICVRFSKKEFGQKAVIIISASVKKNILSDEVYTRITDYINSNNHYVVKHCEKFNTPTYIVRSGIVNRYGYLITENPLEIPEVTDMPFPKGCFKKEVFASLEQIEEFMK